MIKGRKVYDPLTDTWSTGYWVVDDKGNYYPAWQKGAVMERLTNREYGEISCTGKIIPYSPYCSGCVTSNCDCGIVEDMVKKLVDYEDLEEQGRLIKLPCKYVYYIVDINEPKYAMVMKRSIRELAIHEIESIDKENCKYFSTKEKAEEKLKELRGGENESSN